MTEREYKRALYFMNREKRLARMKALYREKRQERIEYQRAYRLRKKGS